MDKIIVFDNVSALGPFGLNTVNGSHPARRAIALNATNIKLNFSSCLTPFYRTAIHKIHVFLSVSHLQIVDTEVTSLSWRINQQHKKLQWHGSI